MIRAGPSTCVLNARTVTDVDALISQLITHKVGPKTYVHRFKLPHTTSIEMKLSREVVNFTGNRKVENRQDLRMYRLVERKIFISLET